MKNEKRFNSPDCQNRYNGQAPANKGFRYAIIEVTTKCQLACPGCYMVRRRALNSQVMSLKTALYILDICREYRQGQELETMDILGGELLLWPYLKEYVLELLRRGIKPWIFTNMLAITPELAVWLYERRVNITGKLNINPDDNGQLKLQAELIGRDRKIARQMIAAIKTFLQAGYRDPLFRLENLIRKNNLTLIPQYYRWCLENNIGTDLEVMGSGEVITDDYWKIAPTPQQLAQLITEIQIVRQDFGLRPAEVLMPHVFGSCRFYDAGLYFDVRGGIRACSNSTISLGSIFGSDPIRQAYESDLICNRLKLSQDILLANLVLTVKNGVIAAGDAERLPKARVIISAGIVYVPCLIYKKTPAESSFSRPGFINYYEQK